MLIPGFLVVTKIVTSKHFTDCGCNEEGSIDNNCDKTTGVCSCKKNWFGDKCQGKLHLLTFESVNRFTINKE